MGLGKSVSVFFYVRGNGFFSLIDSQCFCVLRCVVWLEEDCMGSCDLCCSSGGMG